MGAIDTSFRDQARREVGARLARALIVLGAALWIAGIGANLLFEPAEGLFFAGMIGGGMVAAGLVMRGLQVVMPRRFALYVKVVALVFLLLLGWGLFFGFTLLAALPFGDASPLSDGGKQ